MIKQVAAYEKESIEFWVTEAITEKFVKQEGNNEQTRSLSNNNE
jgi:hypothetical protein